jgi:hypothetical protein
MQYKERHEHNNLQKAGHEQLLLHFEEALYGFGVSPDNDLYFLAQRNKSGKDFRKCIKNYLRNSLFLLVSSCDAYVLHIIEALNEKVSLFLLFIKLLPLSL